MTYTSYKDYCGRMTFCDGTPALMTADGYVTSLTATPVYNHFVRDRRGSVRIVYTDEGQITQVNHYYPYGGLLGESVNTGVQPYKYEGKELSRTGGMYTYDFGARTYSPGMPIFHQQDPHAERYYDAKPYTYCHGNPERYIDPNGKDSYLIIWPTYNGHYGHAALGVDNYVYDNKSKKWY